MIDFHSHILPGVDDGSSSVEESLQMLQALSKQGVHTVAATPHFYATHRSPREFLERRQASYERLSAAYTGDSRILLGGEVLYFPGLSRIEDLPLLCLEGTRVLLLEMPWETWSEYMVRELLELARSGEYILLLAHMERYYSRQKRSVWDTLLDGDILMQSNADFFLRFSTRGKALRLLKEGRIHLLGTDCHNMDSRAPRMGEAVRTIRDRLGRKPLADMAALGSALLWEGEA